MDEPTLQERVEKYAGWYLTNVQNFDVLEDLIDENGGIDGLIARDSDGGFRFVYLSHYDANNVQQWNADFEFSDVREQFERDMVQFYSKDEPQEGEVFYAELRALVLGSDRAIFKFITAELSCSGVCA